MRSTTSPGHADLRLQALAGQLDQHYRQFPAIVVAPAAGAVFTAWVLWNAVPTLYLQVGLGAVLTISAIRFVLYRLYVADRDPASRFARWSRLATGVAFASGCVWGTAAPLLYPAAAPGYEVFVVVLLTLVPIIPFPALAAYLPAFVAYYAPCVTPFVVMLATSDSGPQRMTAVLLVMMGAALTSFAYRHSRQLADASALRVRLAERTRELEAAIAQKARIVAAASHDLRDPVDAASLFVGALRDELRDVRGLPPQSTVCVDGIAGSLAALRQMLDHMIEISKLDAQVVVARQQPIEAQTLLRKLHDEFAPQAALHRLRFRCRARDVVIRSDPALLERLLRNLLSNALNLTRRGGVALLCRTNGRHALLQVVDTGPGIEPAQQGLVFEEFTPVDSAFRRREKGLGLGLAIVKRLAALLDHDVTLRSRPGKGTVFTVRVPLVD